MDITTLCHWDIDYKPSIGTWIVSNTVLLLIIPVYMSSNKNNIEISKPLKACFVSRVVCHVSSAIFLLCYAHCPSTGNISSRSEGNLISFPFVQLYSVKGDCSLTFILPKMIRNLYGQPTVHVNYLNVFFPQVTWSIHVVVTLHTIHSQTDCLVKWHQCSNLSETDSGSIISFKVRLNSSPTTI